MVAILDLWAISLEWHGMVAKPCMKHRWPYSMVVIFWVDETSDLYSRVALCETPMARPDSMVVVVVVGGGGGGGGGGGMTRPACYPWGGQSLHDILWDLVCHYNRLLTSSVGPKVGLTAALDTRMSNFPNLKIVCSTDNRHIKKVDRVLPNDASARLPTLHLSPFSPSFRLFPYG